MLDDCKTTLNWPQNPLTYWHFDKNNCLFRCTTGPHINSHIWQCAFNPHVTDLTASWPTAKGLVTLASGSEMGFSNLWPLSPHDWWIKECVDGLGSATPLIWFGLALLLCCTALPPFLLKSYTLKSPLNPQLLNKHSPSYPPILDKIHIFNLDICKMLLITAISEHPRRHAIYYTNWI